MPSGLIENDERVSARRDRKRDFLQMEMSVSEIKSEHTDGVIRRELVSRECAQRPEQPEIAAHPC
jgi:hypothetical protein